jgi:Leucine Rich Repeat (LRR) protein
MTTPPPKRRHWLQFRLRTLLLAVLVLSLPLSWFALETKRARRQAEIVTSIAAAGGKVNYENVAERAPGWLRNLLGEDFCTKVEMVYYARDIKHHETTSLKALRLQCTYLEGPKVTDAGLQYIAQLPTVESIVLYNTEVTDSGLEHLARLPNLRRLCLWDTERVTDAGLKHVRELAGLEYLNLRGTGITDAGLSHLTTLSNLEDLHAWETNVTPEGIRKLQEILPNCTIRH